MAFGIGRRPHEHLEHGGPGTLRAAGAHVSVDAVEPARRVDDPDVDERRGRPTDQLGVGVGADTTRHFRDLGLGRHRLAVHMHLRVEGSANSRATGVWLTRRVPRPPRAVDPPEAPRLEEELEERSLDELESGARIERARIEAMDLPGVRARGVVVEEARLVAADLSRARLPGLRLADVAVERGNLANTAVPDLSLQRVAFTGARLTGAQWTRGTITDVTFRDCRIDLATFAGTTFERVAFDGCLLAQADFRDALWRSVRFDRCDLTEVDLAGLRTDRCELSGCTLAGLAGIERLRGAAMPWADIVGHAELLAAALGIRVLDG